MCKLTNSTVAWTCILILLANREPSIQMRGSLKKKRRRKKKPGCAVLMRKASLGGDKYVSCHLASDLFLNRTQDVQSKENKHYINYSAENKCKTLLK